MAAYPLTRLCAGLVEERCCRVRPVSTSSWIGIVPQAAKANSVSKRVFTCNTERQVQGADLLKVVAAASGAGEQMRRDVFQAQSREEDLLKRSVEAVHDPAAVPLGSNRDVRRCAHDARVVEFGFGKRTGAVARTLPFPRRSERALEVLAEQACEDLDGPTCGHNSAIGPSVCEQRCAVRKVFASSCSPACVASTT